MIVRYREPHRAVRANRYASRFGTGVGNFVLSDPAGLRDPTDSVAVKLREPQCAVGTARNPAGPTISANVRDRKLANPDGHLLLPTRGKESREQRECNR